MEKETAGENSKFPFSPSLSLSLPIFMANSLAPSSVAPPSLRWRRRYPIFSPNYRQDVRGIRYCAKLPNSESEKPEPENVVLKVAWYGSELLGIAASLLRSPSKAADSVSSVELPVDGLGKIDRAAVVETIKEDFERSYFVTGEL